MKVKRTGLVGHVITGLTVPVGVSAGSVLADRNTRPIDPRHPLVTDRPDFTESTSTVGLGVIQWEAGYTFTHDREGQERFTDHTAPELLLRTGVHEKVELRFGWEGFSATEINTIIRNDVGRTIDQQSHDDGANDLALGVKVHLIDQDGWVPDFGVIAEISIPVGSREKTSGDVDPEIKWLWAYDLSERWSLAGNVNIGVPTSDDGRFFQSAASVALGHALTENLGAYVEYFGFYPDDRGADCAHYANGGFTYQLSPDVQVDIRVGWGLNEQADDFFTGVGLAHRLDMEN